MTSSTSSGAIPDRRTASATASVLCLRASTPRSEPLNEVPTAVLAIETITASGIGSLTLPPASAGSDTCRSWRFPAAAGTNSLVDVEAQGAVEADVLPIEVGIDHNRLDQEGELFGSAHALGKHDVLCGILFQVRKGAEHHGSAHRPGGDGADPDPHRRQVPRHGERHSQNGRFGRPVGYLATLALHTGNGCGIDYHPALSVLVRFIGAHGRTDVPAHVEGARGVHLQGLHERLH